MNQQRVNNPPNAARIRHPRRWPSRAPCIPRKATLVKRRTPTPRLGPPAARRRRRGRIMGLPRSEPFATSLLRLRPQPANRAVPHPPRSPNGTAAGRRRNNCSAEEKRHVAAGGRSETGRGGSVMGDFCLRARQSLVHPRQTILWVDRHRGRFGHKPIDENTRVACSHLPSTRGVCSSDARAL